MVSVRLMNVFTGPELSSSDECLQEEPQRHCTNFDGSFWAFLEITGVISSSYALTGPRQSAGLGLLGRDVGLHQGKGR